MTIKIIFADHVASKRYGGAERVLDTLISNLDVNKYKSILLVGKSSEPNAGLDWQCSGISEVVEVNFGDLNHKYRLAGILKLFINWIRVAKKVIPVIRKNRPATVLSNTLVAAFYIAPLAWLFRMEHIYYEHNIHEQRSKSILRLALKPVCFCSSKVICISGVVFNSLLRAGIDKEKLRVVHNCFDFRDLENITPAVVSGANPRTLSVGMVANFMPWKNHHLFLDLVDSLSKALPGICIDAHLIGSMLPTEKGYYAGIEERIAAYKGLAKFTMHGFRPDAKNWIAGFDLLIHPADEPFGLVYLEAMYLETLVIASCRGASAEIIEDGIDGVLIDFNDINVSTERLVALLEDNDKRRELVQTARRKVASQFSVERYIENIESVLEV